eukprot:gene11449-biopygen3172
MFGWRFSERFKEPDFGTAANPNAPPGAGPAFGGEAVQNPNPPVGAGSALGAPLSAGSGASADETVPNVNPPGVLRAMMAETNLCNAKIPCVNFKYLCTHLGAHELRVKLNKTKPNLKEPERVNSCRNRMKLDDNDQARLFIIIKFIPFRHDFAAHHLIPIVLQFDLEILSAITEVGQKVRNAVSWSEGWLEGQRGCHWARLTPRLARRSARPTRLSLSVTEVGQKVSEAVTKRTSISISYSSRVGHGYHFCLHIHLQHMPVLKPEGLPVAAHFVYRISF